MAEGPIRESDRALVARLEALASLNRLQLLRSIRSPRTLREIRILDEGTGPPLARQSVRWHLDALLAADLVRSRSAEREQGETNEFVLNHHRIFALSEELRELARLRPTLEVEAATSVEGHPATPKTSRPCLLLVSGLDVGSSFAIGADREGQEWTIGRRRGAEIELDFDASVSGENAVVRWADARHWVEDLPGSRNGTRVNGVTLRAAERVPLSHGDLIGVGRCLLLYWA